MISPDVLVEDVIPRIVEHGVGCLPHEACGFVCPDGTIFFLTNETDEENAYKISGDQLGAAFYQADGAMDLGFDLEDVTFWHTHPSGSLEASPEDLQSRRQDIFVDIPHIIVGLPGGEVTYY